MPFEGALQNYVHVEPPPAVETAQQRIIREARTLLSDPARWYAGDFQFGSAFCILGALRYVHSGHARRAGTGGASRYVTMAVQKRGGLSIQAYNDRVAQHTDILAVLDEAYAIAGKKAKTPEAAL